MTHRKNTIDVKKLAIIGMLSALVFALSWVEIKFPLPTGGMSRIHFGNIMCLLSGVLFGPFIGGFASGFGSMLYDFTNPAFIAESWITFINKFLMGFTAGILSLHISKKLPDFLRYCLSALAGSLVYVVLYLGKSVIMMRFVLGNPWEAVLPSVATMSVVSVVNGALAVVVCTIYAPTLRKSLEASGIFSHKAKPGAKNSSAEHSMLINSGDDTAGEAK